MNSSEAHRNMMMQVLSDSAKAEAFSRVIFDLIIWDGKDDRDEA